MAAAAVLAVLLGASASAEAGGAFRLREGKEVVGLERTYVIKGKETLHDVARQFDVGYNEVADANPGVDPWLPGTGTRVVVPSEWVLPESGKSDIVINVAEMRLYKYSRTKGRRYVRSYPIGVGIEGHETPVGDFTVRSKIVAPVWYSPESVRRDNPGMPRIVKAGEDNPMGGYALELSDFDIYIHGTNKPFGIGKRVSYGCIRLYPEDIKELFYGTREKSKVQIVYQPVKLGVKDGKIVVEVHKDFMHKEGDLYLHAMQMVEERGLMGMIEMDALIKAAYEETGRPVVIGTVVHEDGDVRVTSKEQKDVKRR